MSDRDRWWLTATVWMEASGEPRDGMVAVAHVLLNRLRAKRWGRTPGEVCLAAFQFSCWNTDSPTRPSLARVDEASKTWIDATNAVERARTGVDPDPTLGALHYYNPAWAHPAWDQAKTLPRVTIGRHVFVRDVP